MTHDLFAPQQPQPAVGDAGWRGIARRERSRGCVMRRCLTGLVGGVHGDGILVGAVLGPRAIVKERRVPDSKGEAQTETGVLVDSRPGNRIDHVTVEGGAAEFVHGKPTVAIEFDLRALRRLGCRQQE